MTERTRGSVGVFPEIGIYSGPVPFDEHPEIQKYDYFAFLESCKRITWVCAVQCAGVNTVRIFLK
jgi:hypothetical protein